MDNKINDSSGPAAFRLTPIRLLIAILVISILCLVSIPAYMNIVDGSRRAACAGNLKMLYEGMFIYVHKFGENKYFAPHVGEKFFHCLSGCTDSVHPATYKEQAPYKDNLQYFLCPSTNSKLGAMDYSGPSEKTMNRIYVRPEDLPHLDSGEPPEVISCDKICNHTNGGNILFLYGGVVWDEDWRYRDALRVTE